MASLTMNDLNSNVTKTPSKQPNRCGSCMFFVRFTKDNLSLGECHVVAPIVFAQAQTRFGIFPIVNDTNFCGEYTGS